MPSGAARSDEAALLEGREAVLREIREDEVVELTRDLVRIPSFTTEETPVARFLARYLEEQGIEAELSAVEDGRFQVIGRLRGDGDAGDGPSLLFDGHIDIDPIARGWKRNPFHPVVEDGRLYGAGTYNMKGGVAAMVMAAVALRRAAVPLRGELIVAGVVGELQGGVGTVHLLQQGMRIDMGVVPEPHGVENLMTTHCGVMQLAINTHGVSEHTTRKDEAVDAIAAMVKAVRALDRIRFTCEPRADLPGLPRMNIGSIIGGRGKGHELRGPNNVADHATVLADIRFLPGQTPEAIVADIRRTLDPIARDDPKFRYSVEFPAPKRFRLAPFAMPPCDAPRDSFIVRTVAANHARVTGREPATIGALLPKSYSGNDTGHLWARGIPCVLYGPWGGFVPTPDSVDHYVTLDELTTCTRTLALTALDVCTRSRAEVADAGGAGARR
ncbi:MAG: M20 family metallopeptidase [Candidatus Rokuibacteriota bacterium]